MRIGFDIDGVLANFEASYAPLLTARSGIEFPRLGQPDWPDVWYWEREAGVTKEQEAAVWTEDILPSIHFWASLQPTKECEETLAYLNKCRLDGDYVCFITSRPGEFAKDATVKWLLAQGFDDPNVFVCNSADAKAEKARDLDLDFFIDDKDLNVEAVAEVVPYVVILDRPWNKSYDGLCPRAKSPIAGVEWARKGLMYRELEHVE